MQKKEKKKFFPQSLIQITKLLKKTIRHLNLILDKMRMKSTKMNLMIIFKGMKEKFKYKILIRS